MKTRWIFFLLSISVSLPLFHCGSDKEGEKIPQKAQVPPHEEILQEYFTKANPGKWHDLPQDHAPNVNIFRDKKNINIVVTPPFEGNPTHYIEPILLTDYQVKELQKKSFPKGSTATNTIFKLPLETKGEFYVILKCNQHDMWYEKIRL